MNWSVPLALRARRELIGLSQADLAQALNVSKSLLCHIEAGKRQPTVEQVNALCKLLGMPPDLLMLGCGRLPGDVHAALNANAAEVVAAVRQRYEANALSYPQCPETIPLPKEPSALVHSEALPERIDASKTSTSYRTHSYHTKLPPEAIAPFVRAFTRPGEVVFDPFCGSGMTGVAALMEKRNALLSDLSPAAVHIARNYTTPCDPREFADALKRVETIVRPTIDWLYRPIGAQGVVEYTTWSDIFRCKQCLGRIGYWDCVQTAGGTSNDGIVCPKCAAVHRKADLEWIGEYAVQSHTSRGSNRIDSHVPTRQELALIEEAARTPIPYWTPAVAFGPEREMWRAGHRSMGISSVADFFTRRNLHALAALRHVIVGQSEGRVREALLFAFTAAVNRASKRYQWNSKRPTNVMTGTLYISSLRYEWNVWSLFRRKAADVFRYYRQFPSSTTKVEVFQRPASDLGCLPDGSIDCVIMDPPFGSNIFYADSSLLWDAWLGTLTDEAGEIVINKHRGPSVGGKSIDNYEQLMCQSFEQVARVLKPGGRAVLAFSNSDDAVWNSVQRALRNAGFSTSRVHVLHKGQPSIKGVKGVTGKENVTTFDLVLCLEHHTQKTALITAFPPPASFVDQIICDLLAAGGGRNDEIYSKVIRAALAQNYSVSGVTMPAIAKRCSALGARLIEGRWRLASDVSNKGRQADFITGYLTNVASLPQSAGTPEIDNPISALRVPGGRNSPFYTAHSYHTKVPPEAISPFIEHYTKPGDVVLDPFSGSGMTGVAAALAGRKAILSDLSPAAAHLAWNHTRPCNPEALAAAFNEIDRAVSKQFKRLYATQDGRGRPSLIHWTLWSTRHRCPKCAKEFLLWDAMDRKTGRLGSSISCPRCNKQVRRSDLEVLGSQPAWVAYEDQDGRRFEKPASKEDIKHALKFRRSKIKAWFPTTPLTADREMFIRCALQLQSVSSVADLYTSRNLHALALIWQEIGKVSDERIKRALAFAFTNTAWHGTRMRRFNARGGQRPLTGTLYIPQLSSEANVLEVIRNKIAQLQRYYRAYQPHGIELPAILLRSADDLAAVPNEAADYVFTDPPFGSNIFYADCNLIWEAWLGRITETSREAVVNRSLSLENGGKSLTFYSKLIAGAMKEVARVLKPGGWATVVFHNTDAAVWKAIRDAASDAHFEFYEAASLDRRQQSHKGYKGRSGAEDVAHFDVVLNLRKPANLVRRAEDRTDTSVDPSSLVAAAVLDPEVSARGLQGVHAEVMRQLASRETSNFVDYALVREIWERQSKTVVTQNDQSRHSRPKRTVSSS